MRIFAPPAVRSQVLIVDFDATVAMREVIPALIPAPEAEQTTSLAAPLDLTSQTPWESFASRWLGKMDGVVNGVGKAAIRGDRALVEEVCWVWLLIFGVDEEAKRRESGECDCGIWGWSDGVDAEE